MQLKRNLFGVQNGTNLLENNKLISREGNLTKQNWSISLTWLRKFNWAGIVNKIDWKET